MRVHGLSFTMLELLIKRLLRFCQQHLLIWPGEL